MRKTGLKRAICSIGLTMAILAGSAASVFASEYFIDTTVMPTAGDWNVVSSPKALKQNPKKENKEKKKEEKEVKEELPEVGKSPISDIETSSGTMSMPEEPTGPEPEPIEDESVSFMSDMNADTGETTPAEGDIPSTEGMEMPSMPTPIEPAKSDAKEAEDEFRERTTPNINKVDEPTALKRQEAPSILETTQWKITDANRTTKINVNVFAGETRFEMFYSNKAPIPALTFTSQDGNIYRIGEEDFNNGKTRFIVRPGNKIEGNSDVDYCVIYISAPTDPGSWTAEVTLDKGTKEFMLIKTAVPNGWSDFVEEYRMTPEEMCLWHLAKSSDYSIQELITLANNDANPGSNTTMSSEPPVYEEKDYTIPIIIGVFVIIIAAMITATFLIIKKSNMAEEERAKKHVSRANKILQQKKDAQNRNLANALKELDEDYTDEDYFTEDSTYEDPEEEIEIEIPVQKNDAAYDELDISNDNAPSIEDVIEEEKTVVAMPSWLSEDNTAAGFF